MNHVRMEGLFAATVTPFDSDGRLRLDQVNPIVEHLEADGLAGIYICGSTGEGVSLRDDERRATSEAYVRAAAGRLKTFIQVGHNSLSAARDLAVHAQAIGADAVSATCPSYFKIDSAAMLVEAMAQVAAGAPGLPFYYYHIPALTNVNLDMMQFIEMAESRIPTFAGLKFTTPAAHDFQMCLEHKQRRYDALWGVDEMLLPALAVGARGAVGSTYNVAAPIALKIIASFESGDIQEARRWQLRLNKAIRTLLSFPFLAALKQTLSWLAADCGSCRLPLQSLSNEQAKRLREELETMEFFEWRRRDAGVSRRVDGSSATAAHPPGAHRPASAAPGLPRDSRVATQRDG